jgi:hypothetical protein
MALKNLSLDHCDAMLYVATGVMPGTVRGDNPLFHNVHR